MDYYESIFGDTFEEVWKLAEHIAAVWGLGIAAVMEMFARLMPMASLAELGDTSREIIVNPVSMKKQWNLHKKMLRERIRNILQLHSRPPSTHQPRKRSRQAQSRASRDRP